MRVYDRGGPGYPRRLEELALPPDRLWVRGALPRGPSVAVVGTRGPDRDGRQFARELGRELARAGVTVVSGGARGIDAAAHEGALEAGGRTVAVLGTGVDVVYPREHAALYERIAAAGALCSELPPGAPPLRRHFPTRNRIVAVLGGATVVVQAPARSGALSTAAFSRTLGRPLVAVPWSPYERRGAGTAMLIRKGAVAACSVRDALRALGLRASRRIRESTPRAVARRPGAANAILRVLDQGALYLAEIVDETGLRPEVVLSEILTLTMERLVEEVDFQRFGRTRPPPDG